MIYRFGEFEADVGAGSLTRAGVPVHLRRKSFQVLALLLLHRSRLVSKEEILAEVWSDVAVTDDVLVGVVGELRKALGDSSENPLYIRTMRGTGYRFIASVEPGDSADAQALPESVVADPGVPQVRNRRRGPVRLAVLLLSAFGAWLVLVTRGVLPGIRPRPPRLLREIAWWRFDESGGPGVNDASGNGNGGEIRGGARRVRRGLSGAIDLDGIRGQVIGSVRSLPHGGLPLTFTAWVRVDATSNDFTNIFQYGYGRDEKSHVLHSVLLSMVRPDGHWEAAAEGVTSPIIGRRLDDGRWHQIAVRYDGSLSNTAALYTDGEEDASGKWSDKAGRHAAEVWGMGQFPLFPATFFHGGISDVRLYPKGLSRHQINALYRCSSEGESVSFQGKSYYFVPLYGDVVEAFADRDGAPVDNLRNRGKDFSGATFAERIHSCSLPWVESADVGQDLRISADLLVPGDEAGHHTQAGPFLRSRLAASGDGIMGGTSAGFWVALDSNGTVTVRRLNPLAVVAFASISRFDSAVPHHLETVAVGERLQVKLDGSLVAFTQEGRQTETVAILPLWKGPPAIGSNQGGAGIEFAAIDSRGMIGCQEARNIRLEPARALW